MRRKKYSIVFLILVACCGILFTDCKGNDDAAKIQRIQSGSDTAVNGQKMQSDKNAFTRMYFWKMVQAEVSAIEFLQIQTYNFKPEVPQKDNEECFYDALSNLGVEKEEAKAYFEILLKDDVFQNGKMEFSGLVIDDIDENGQMDMLVRVQDPAEEFLYGAGCGGTGDWYPVILKYKEYGIERMEIPTYEEGDYAYYPSIYVVVYQEPQKDTYSAYCPYLNDTIVFHSPNFWQDAALPETTVGAGSNSRGFIDLQCVEYQGKNALQVSEYLYGEGGHVHCVAFANFIIMWDKEGNGRIADWWIDPS